MDRTSFLRLQPFLFLLSPLSVKDHLEENKSEDAAAQTTPRFSKQNLLSNLCLSIEPIENSLSEGILPDRCKGPAYFVPSEPKKEISEKDPAMCSISMTLYTAILPEKGMITPVKKPNRRRLSEIETRENVNEMILVATIDGNYFQVDWSQLLKTSVGKEEHRTIDGIARPSHPAYLLLEFPSCSLRIFAPSLSSDDETVVDEADAPRETIDFGAIDQQLKRILVTDSVLPFPLSYSGLISSFEERPEISSDVRVRDCLQAYAKSWRHLEVLDHALGGSMELEPQCTNVDLKNIITRLMKTIPNHVASSFLDRDEWSKAIHHHDQRLVNGIQDFDDLIDDFMTQNERKRRKLERDSETEDTQNNSIEQYRQLLKKYKGQLVAKHELHLLPLKG